MTPSLIHGGEANQENASLSINVLLRAKINRTLGLF
jgi:hypothetical protein